MNESPSARPPSPERSLQPAVLEVPRSRRAHRRVRAEIDVTIHTESRFQVGFTENLSAGGIFVATHLVRPIGSRLELTLRLPASFGLCRGVFEVRWLRPASPSGNQPPGLGLELIALEPGAREALGQFVMALLTE